jgi:hypothetical protein
MPFADGKDPVLMLQAPSEIHFPVEPGQGTLVGRFGILPDAYPVTDGVTFEVRYQGASGTAQSLFQRTLDPHNVNGDRGLFDLNVPLQIPGKGELVLLTYSPPGKGAGCEWSCWTDLKIQFDSEAALANQHAPATGPAQSADQPPATAPVEISGSLEVADSNSIDGWCWDERRPNEPIEVKLIESGRVIATTSASIDRADLVTAGIGNGRHGFHFDTPRAMKDGRPHTVHAVASGVEMELSPRTIIAPPGHQ